MKKIAVANDISGAGRCSLTADLPVISALGVQCCPLVTSVFSAQTGYGSYHVRDLSGDIMPTVEDWSAKGFLFDAVLTGFIASSESGKEIIWAAKTLKKSDTLFFLGADARYKTERI